MNFNAINIHSPRGTVDIFNCMAPHVPRPASIPNTPDERLNVFVNFCNATLAAAPDTRAAMSSILDFIVQATGATGAAIAMPEGDALVISSSTRSSANQPGERFRSSSLAARVYAERKTYLANSTVDIRTDPTRSYSRLGTTVMAPIMQGRRAYGVLLVKHPAAYGIQAKEAQAVNEFAGICGSILGSAIYLEEKIDPRMIDPDTGLGNARAYERDLAMQMDLYRRFGVPVSVALFSCAPHLAQQWSGILRGSVRDSDAAFRISDALFAVILKNCGEQHAGNVRERIGKQLPAFSSSTVATPRAGEGTRPFRTRLEQSQRPQSSEHPRPPRSVWERFAQAIA